jgi:hypothetical protein
VPYYRFQKGTIRHIHAVQFDSFSKRVWIATGDHDSECQIGFFKSAPSGSELEVVASGTQRTRAVSLLFTNDFVYWGTDADGRSDFAQANHIYRWSRQTHKVEELAKVGGPVYYSCLDAAGHLFFATTVEGGVSDSFARLWTSNDGVKWNEIRRWQKDRYPYLFGYGTLSFAGGRSTKSRLYVTAKGMKGRCGTWAFEAQDLVT